MTIPTDTLPGPWPQQMELWSAAPAPAAPTQPTPRPQPVHRPMTPRRYVQDVLGIVPRRSRYRDTS